MADERYPYPIRKIGYARVSTDEQDLYGQVDALKRDGVLPDDIYMDKKSGRSMKREGLQSVIMACRPGDTLVVASLDRLSRSLKDLIFLFEQLDGQGIVLRSLREHIDGSTAIGRMMFQMAGVFAEFERARGAERTKSGIDARRRAGTKWGRERALTEKQVAQCIKLLRANGGDVNAVAKRFKVVNSTVRDSVLRATGEKLWPPGPRAPKAERAKAKRRRPKV